MEQFDLVFQGKILEGFDLQQVKRDLATALKASEDNIEKIFSGSLIRLKKNLHRDQAERFQQHLARIGARADLIPSNGPTPAPSAPVKSTMTLEPQISRRPDYPKPEVAAQVTVERDDTGSVLLNLLNPGAVLTLIIVLVGIVFIIAFSPYPDGVIKKGLVIGLLITLITGRKLLDLLRR